MRSPNYKKNTKIIRCFAYSNIHEVNSNLEKLTFFYTKKEHISIKSLIKVSTFLELITGQRSFFLRSKKSLASLKIRRGLPIGAKVTLRKSALFSFLYKLIWLVLPNIKNFYSKLNFNKLKQNKFNSLSLTIPSALNFLDLQSFYFFFKSFNNLKIVLSFSKVITKNELYFSSRFYKLPF